MATAGSDRLSYDSPPRWRGGEGALKEGPFFYQLAPCQHGRSIRVTYARTDKQARATWPESQLSVDSAERCKGPVVADLGLRTRLAMLRRAPYLGFVGMGMTFVSAKRPVAGGVTR